MFRHCSSVRQLAETAIVLRRNIGGDHFAFSRGQSVRATRENVREFAQRALVLSGLIAIGPSMPGTPSGTECEPRDCSSLRSKLQEPLLPSPFPQHDS
jgi:hypothetical protein